MSETNRSSVANRNKRDERAPPRGRGRADASIRALSTPGKEKSSTCGHHRSKRTSQPWVGRSGDQPPGDAALHDRGGTEEGYTAYNMGTAGVARVLPPTTRAVTVYERAPRLRGS